MVNASKNFILVSLDLFYPLFKRLLPRQVFAYLAVGAANTILNVCLFAMFYQLIFPQRNFSVAGGSVASYTLSLLIAFFITVPTGFWLSKNFAFTDAKADKQSFKQLMRYFLVVLQGLGSDYLVMKGLIVYAGLNPSIAKIISTMLVLTLNYLLQRSFTFNTKS